MKFILGVSLLINLVLGVLYYQKVQEPPLERIVMEEKFLPQKTRIVTKEVIVEKTSPAPVAGPSQETQRLAEETFEKVSEDRTAFLLMKLDLSQEELDKIDEIKERSFKKLNFPRKFGELSVDDRRRLLDIEQDREKAMLKLMGKAKWEKFKKFKNDYNRQKFQEAGEFGVVVPLDI